MSDLTEGEGGSLLAWLLRFCLENKLVVFLAVAVVIVWGIAVAPFDWHLEALPRDPVPVDAIPDIGENQQIVFTRWMGRSPQDVEDQVTYPLTTVLLGIPGVKTVRSVSMFGFSSVYVIFEEDVGFKDAQDLIVAKLNGLPPGLLPDDAQPALGPFATALGQIYWYTLEGRDPDGNPVGGWDPQELRSIQDWLVRYPLMSADGIAEVASVGGFVREYQVDVDPDAMRAYGVKLQDVFNAVRMSNTDVGARTIEVNRVEYVVRGRGFIGSVADIENVVVAQHENVPIYVKDIGRVTTGPALRRGALDKGGAEAVGGVVVVRYGYNPLAAIQNVKAKVEEIEPGLGTRAVVDYERVGPEGIREWAREQGFEAYASAMELDQDAWLTWLRTHDRADWPEWVTTSSVTIQPFYDRTGLIYETLGTLRTALEEEILVTIIVVVVMVMHLRSSLLIGGLLPLAVLMCFIAMKSFGVDANIVALSGIAIAIGTMVDMGIIVCENVLKHLDDAPPDANRLEVVLAASREVGSAVVTAVSTTVISFLPVFTMTGAEGKLFKPLAFTKTFALIASVIVALAVIPPLAHILFVKKKRIVGLRHLLPATVSLAGVVAGFLLAWWAGLCVLVLAAWWLLGDRLPDTLRLWAARLANSLVVVIVTWFLCAHWMPLGPARGFARNFAFIALLIGGLLLFFQLFRFVYRPMLRWCLDHKALFLTIPAFLVVFGGFAWLGAEAVVGPMQSAPSELEQDPERAQSLMEAGLLEERPGGGYLWSRAALDATEADLHAMIEGAGVDAGEDLVENWRDVRRWLDLRDAAWGKPDFIRDAGIARKVRWTIAQGWSGLGKEFMPPLDEGSYLYMPTTMTHASIGEALDIIAKQDKAFAAIPEIESVVGKLGRAETPLDPAPISMIETVINYRPEYILDAEGHRVRFRHDGEDFVRDEDGELIPDPDGRPFRQWRDHIRTPDDIWQEILDAGSIPGTTSAPKLQPIAARIVMLQSGMRAPMGVKVKGPDLDAIEDVGLQIEKLLKEVPGVEPASVIADRIVGKPYLEIEINRPAIARYGLHVKTVQDIIEVAVGGKTLTRTVEGRERYPVRVRYARELRDNIEDLGRILVPATDGAQIPLEQLADITYVRGPQAIKSEDTQLVGYVLFDRKPGYAEVDVVENCQEYLRQRRADGRLDIPSGISYEFAGSYENQVRSQKTLAVVLPVALTLIFLILYFQFKSVWTTMLVFSGIVIAWAGGFLFIWLYNQPWALDFSVFGVNMRELFQLPEVDPVTGAVTGAVTMSVAVWVGFLALFGIASDNGVVIATYLDQSFARRRPESIREIREATLAGAQRRLRPCLMTSATTILALIPVLTSTGRGSDVMVPMAIPSFGGMMVVLISVFAVPVLYSLIQEVRFRLAGGAESDGTVGAMDGSDAGEGESGENSTDSEADGAV